MFLPAFIILFAIIYLESSGIIKKYENSKTLQAILKQKAFKRVNTDQLLHKNGKQNFKKIDFDESPSSWTYRVIIILIFAILACVLIVLYFVGNVKQIQPPQY